MATLRRILAPTDFSPVSDIAVQYALDMAARFGAEIHLLHVVDDAAFAVAYADGVYVPPVEALREGLIKDATGHLQKAVAQCTSSGVMATSEVLIGAPARVIAQTATSRETDLIVMGTHGRGAFAHVFLGSVAERVVRTAPCAVLTVRDTAHIADLVAAQRVSAHATAQLA